MCIRDRMNPNHYLAVAIDYLYGGARPQWAADGFIGKTLVSVSYTHLTLPTSDLV
mgnify:CR=1 FL=1